MNRRETLAMYRIAVMRQRHQRATAQRQAAAEAAKQHTESTAPSVLGGAVVPVGRRQCVQIAREAAVYCGERHAYMPATELLAETWQPHRWVIDAMLLAAHEAERERDSFRAGNTDLLEILMNLCMGQQTDPLIKARVILKAAGLMSTEGTLDWKALEARRPKPITWAQAVEECVTDPAERARLLAMSDSDKPIA